MMDLSFWPCRIKIKVGDSVGFNPCYDGFVILTGISSGLCIDHYDKFQSLLWWICHFDGVDAETIAFQLEFQSLLWWICHFDSPHQNIVAPNFWFQSLLWWICHFDSCRSVTAWCSTLSFQSLLWWICHFDLPILSENSHIMMMACVSILVMMDLSFWH